MKLRNKKTGEIAIADITRMVSGVRFNCGQSLAELNEEWEDYEEPKEFYFIDQFMSVSKGVVDDVEYAGRHKAVNYAKKTSNNLKTAGNYFETREEAEKAVEKLKAWKRLKDKGFKFNGVEVFSEGLLEIDGILSALEGIDNVERLKIIDDLDLLFSQEDD